MGVNDGSEAGGAHAAGAGTAATPDPAAEIVGLAAKLLRLQSRLGAHPPGAGQGADPLAVPGLPAQHGSARHAAVRSGIEVLRGFAVSLVGEIQESIERDAFHYLYQPIASVASGAVEGYAALLRWQRGQESVPPPLFLPIAEQAGMLPRIQQRLLGEVATVLARLGPAVTIGIDWSVAQLADADAITAMIEWAAQGDNDAARVIIEINDRAGMPDPGSLRASLVRLRKAGFRLALDGFCGGHGGFAYLGRLPIDLIKIDASLIGALEHSARAALIVEGIIDLAHRLGHRVVAQGVGTAQQLARLAALGCDLAQGDTIGGATRDPVASATRRAGAA
ncbi:MAG TPA: EAL domain-containing protein [Steroidobacteraceae bacterium]|jgi:EAL domain-containing protein (putative c-di-GMP-specific phosphodiesterase class I)|nr:EAL domain-containing protein [Steroidobacteraceae bacterium]